MVEYFLRIKNDVIEMHLFKRRHPTIRWKTSDYRTACIWAHCCLKGKDVHRQKSRRISTKMSRRVIVSGGEWITIIFFCLLPGVLYFCFFSKMNMYYTYSSTVTFWRHACANRNANVTCQESGDGPLKERWGEGTGPVGIWVPPKSRVM